MNKYICLLSIQGSHIEQARQSLINTSTCHKMMNIYGTKTQRKQHNVQYMIKYTINLAIYLRHYTNKQY